MYLALLLLAAAQAPQTQALQMTLRGGAKPAACGETAKITLHGHFPAGTKVQIRRDDVTLEHVKQTPTTLSATLKLAKTALPGPVALDATSPGARASLIVAVVNEKLRLSLQFEDGWSAALNQARSGAYDVVWRKETTTSESRAEVAPLEGGLRINFQANPQTRDSKEALGCSQAILRGKGGQLEGNGQCAGKEMKVTAKLECLGR